MPAPVIYDPELLTEMSADGRDIRQINQPPKRQHTNILDLGIVNSIQDLQNRTAPRSSSSL